MNCDYLKELAEREKENIEVYKTKISELENEMLQTTDEDEKQSSLDSISF